MDRSAHAAPRPSGRRRRLHGYSAGLLVRRYVRSTAATSARLLLRHALTAAKDLARGDGGSARDRLAGVLGGMATGRPPSQAAERSCPYCQGPLLGRYAAVPDWRFGVGPPSDVYRCPDCGALAAGRAPEPQELASWYSDYYTHTVDSAPVRTLWRIWPTPRRRRELKQLRSYLAAPGVGGRFLEVGTGSGERLVQFAQAGWAVVGQDVDQKAGGLARKHGIEVHQCPVVELLGREEPFQLIGLNHVLEHAADPAELMQACASMLAPGGRLCVISPNAQALGRMLFGRWWFGLEQPRHLAIPSLASLERLTSDLGLQVICAKSVSTNASVILGGSLAGWLENHSLPPPLREPMRLVTALLGQALGRVAILLDHRLGEEVVWLGQRLEP